MVSSNRYIYLKLNSYDYSQERLNKVYDYLHNQILPVELETKSDINNIKKDGTNLK